MYRRERTPLAATHRPARRMRTNASRRRTAWWPFEIDARKNEKRDCDAHRLPVGMTAAKRRIQRASCRSGGNTVRRSTTATVQGICPICGIDEILVVARNQRQPVISVALKNSVSLRVLPRASPCACKTGESNASPRSRVARRQIRATTIAHHRRGASRIDDKFRLRRKKSYE